MFGLFKKSPSTNDVEVVDNIWMSTEAKALACSELLLTNPNCLLVAWFEETFEKVKQWIDIEDGGVPVLCMATDPEVLNARDRRIVFVEHYPLSGMEQQLFSRIGKKEVSVLSSLDEPIFELFGGEKIIRTMKKLGMKDDEVISHAMVSASISRAQAKIAKKITVEKRASSQREWFEINYKE
jgi:hypothetical protein